MAQKSKGTSKWCRTCEAFVRPTQTAPPGHCPLCNRDLRKMLFKPLMTASEVDHDNGSGDGE